MCLKKRRKRCFEVKMTAIFNRADIFAYQDYRALTKKGKIGQYKQKAIIKTKKY